MKPMKPMMMIELGVASAGTFRLVQLKHVQGEHAFFITLLQAACGILELGLRAHF